MRLRDGPHGRLLIPVQPVLAYLEVDGGHEADHIHACQRIRRFAAWRGVPCGGSVPPQILGYARPPQRLATGLLTIQTAVGTSMISPVPPQQTKPRSRPCGPLRSGKDAAGARAEKFLGDHANNWRITGVFARKLLIVEAFSVPVDLKNTQVTPICTPVTLFCTPVRFSPFPAAPSLSLSKLLKREKERERAGGQSKRPYYSRRYRRIYFKYASSVVDKSITGVQLATIKWLILLIFSSVKAQLGCTPVRSPCPHKIRVFYD